MSKYEINERVMVLAHLMYLPGPEWIEAQVSHVEEGRNPEVRLSINAGTFLAPEEYDRILKWSHVQALLDGESCEFCHWLNYMHFKPDEAFCGSQQADKREECPEAVNCSGFYHLHEAQVKRYRELCDELERTEKLDRIRERMKGQDNRATAHPIFLVQQKRRIYGLDLEYTDNFVWIYDDGEYETAEELAELLIEVEMTEEEAYESGFLTKTGYVDEWVFVQPFFSEKGAQKYIDENAHNLNEPRIYVDSAYRNDEWQAVRAVLLED